jgi:hypothetical protein
MRRVSLAVLLAIFSLPQFFLSLPPQAIIEEFR